MTTLDTTSRALAAAQSLVAPKKSAPVTKEDGAESQQDVAKLDVARTVEKEELEAAVEAIRTTVHHPNLTFSIHEESGRAFVQVIDTASGEVIRQIPSEEALKAAQALRDGSGGALISETA